MKILSIDEARGLIGFSSADAAMRSIRQALPLACGPYLVPADAGIKTALARQFANFLFTNLGDLILCVRGWKFWPSAENFDLFDGYRISIGETRPLWEAPIHVFTRGEEPALASILNLGLFFYWDMEVFDADSNALFTFSHDEWMEFRLKNQEEADQLTGELTGFNLKEFGGVMRP